MTPDTPSDDPSDAERLYDEWLRHRVAEPGASFEAYCALHSEYRAQLERLDAQVKHLEQVLGPLDAVASLTTRTADRAAPQVTLEGEPGSGFVERIVDRLAGRAGGYARYQVYDEIGRGGQGAVALVWDEDLRRDLAMKIALGQRAGQENRGASPTDTRRLGRFLEEAQVTGQLDHPGIVPVHELGLDPQGRVYFTMKLVKGRDLGSVFALVREGREGWTRTRALNVLLRVCEAMSYAHSKGVIHRDLKPSNVMVGKYGEVYVMDWGLARVLGRRDEKDIRIRPAVATPEVRPARRMPSTDCDSPLITMDGDVLGTPAYMSPEQADGRLDAVGAQSDVYSAGAMLYHLLTGQIPFVPPGARIPPQLVLLSVLNGSPKPVRQLASEAPAELVAICEKAMEREPAKRYADMSKLAEDLSAYLEQRVVHAYRTGAVAELKKWVERNRMLAATVGTALLVLAATTLFYVWNVNGYVVELDETNRRTRALGLAAASAEAMGDDLMLSLLLAREAVETEQVPETISQLHQVVGASRERTIVSSSGVSYVARFSPGGSRILATSNPRRGPTVTLWDLTGNVIAELEGHTDEVMGGAFSTSGDTILTCSADGSVRHWDSQGNELDALHHEGGVWSAAFSPDERFVLCTSRDGTATIWNHWDGSKLEVERYPGGLLHGSFSPDGHHLVTASADGTARLWDFHEEDQEVVRVADLIGHDGPIILTSFSPVGDKILTASGVTPFARLGDSDRTARLWDLDGNQLAILNHDDGVEWAGFDPEGVRILTVSLDGSARLWSVDGNLQWTWKKGPAFRGAFSPSGRRLALGCDDGSAWLFDTSGNELAALLRHESTILSMSFSPDESLLLTSSTDRTLRVWDVKPTELPEYRARSVVVGVSYSPDGTRVVVSDDSQGAVLYDVRGTRIADLRGHRSAMFSATFSPSGDRILTASRDTTARLWDLVGVQLRVFRHDDEVRMASFSPSGDRIVTGTRGGDVVVWDTDGGEELLRIEDQGWVRSVNFSPDGERLLVASRGARIFALNGELIHEIAHPSRIFCATFSPEGHRVLAAYEDGVVRLWGLEGGPPLVEFKGHEAAVWSASFSPSGERIASASYDRTARIWDLRGNPIAILRGHDGPVFSAVFSPRGDRLLTGSADGGARTWFVETEDLVEFSNRRVTRGFTLDELARYQGLLGDTARAARELVQALCDELILKERVVSHLQGDAGLDAALREAALRTARFLEDPSARQLNQEAWETVRDPGSPLERVLRALEQAKVACELSPDTGHMLNTLGVAQYRAGHFEDAIETLLHADEVNRGAKEPHNRAGDLLFLAMACYRLDRREQAQRYLMESRRILEDVADPENRGFLREADELIAED